MKRTTISFKTFLCILCLSDLTLNSGAQFTQKRIFERTEPVNRETILEISNKYGNIEITEWNRDSVYIRAEIEANATNQSKTGKMIEGIEIEISASRFLVRAQTIFDQTLNMLLEDFKGMTNKIISYDSKVQINYFVKAPEYLSLRLENKYGDIFAENIKGNLNVSLSNGSFKAHSVARMSDFRMSFCNAVINKAEDCNIDASFSEFIIDESENLRIKSISSRYDLKYVSTLNADSRRDKFYIGTIGSLSGNAYFTQFRIDKLLTETNINSKYGDITVESIDNSFKEINIIAGYNDIRLTFYPTASYNLNIRHVNSFVSLPSESPGIEKNAVNGERKEYITSGTIGRNPGNRKVKIDASRGNIYIK